MRRFSLTIARAMLGIALLVASTHAAWVPEGNPLCNISGYQHPGGTTRFVATAGPIGSISGMLVVWQDMRSGSGDLYSGFVSDQAPPDPAPGADGEPLIVAPGNQWSPAVTMVAPIWSGAQWQNPASVVAWNHGEAMNQVRAKRQGDSADWGPIGIAVAPADPMAQGWPAITDDGDKGAIVTWLDLSSAQRLVRAQRLDEHGNRIWGDAGVPVGLDTTVQGEPRIARAPGGGAYILRTDYRIAGTLGYLQALVLYRLDGNGATAAGWPADGIVIPAQMPGFHRMIPDGNDGVFIAWTEQEPLSDFSTGLETRVTHIQSDGTPGPGWTLAGVGAFARDDGHRYLEDLDLDGTGGVVLVGWYERVVGGPLPSGRDLVVQRLLANGSRPAGWPAAGHVLCDAPGAQQEARLIGRNGGLLAAWRDERSGGSDLYTLRLEPDGTPAADWDPTGVLLCGAPGTQSSLRLAPSNNGGAVFVWQDWRSPSTGPDLFMQTVSADGRLDAPRPIGTPLALSLPRPSPARDRVELVLDAPEEGNAKIVVLDAAGRVVQRWSMRVAPGRNSLRWDLRSASGRRVAPGVYHMQVSAPWGARTRRVVITG